MADTETKTSDDTNSQAETPEDTIKIIKECAEPTSITTKPTEAAKDQLEDQGDILPACESQDKFPIETSSEITSMSQECTDSTNAEQQDLEPEETTSETLKTTEIMETTDETSNIQTECAVNSEQDQPGHSEENTKDVDGDESQDGSESPSNPPNHDEIDPYSYLKRDEFTSELFKIELTNLPKKCGIHQMKKKLVSMDLHPCKVKILLDSSVSFINFRCEEDREKALKLLDGFLWKGKFVKAKKANPSADPLLLKRKIEQEKVHLHHKKTKYMWSKKSPEREELPVTERLNDAVSPLWRVPYEDQLKQKVDEVKVFLKRLGKEIDRNCYEVSLKNWLDHQYRQYNGLCCNLMQIIPSPVLNNYRNKCEFTIGQSPDGVDKTVGFRLGRYRGGQVSVVQPEGTVILTAKMKICISYLQDFLQNISECPGFNPETKLGNWRIVILRQNRKEDILMLVVFTPHRLSIEEIDSEKMKLQDFFSLGKGKEAPITSLYFRVQSDRRELEDKTTTELLMGEEYICEELLGLKFRVSPDAFFQVNTEASEILYQKVGDWCCINKNTILVDICSGTGTIGLTMASRVKKVIGIEICKEAVEDAKANAALNGITNAEFHLGKAENLLSKIIDCYEKEEVVAVVDPPRNGLHQDVIRALRKCAGVKRLVYVSCKASGALANAVDLTRVESRRVRGNPFRIKQAIPIDLFPHTAYVELVMLFERVDPKEELPPRDYALDY